MITLALSKPISSWRVPHIPRRGLVGLCLPIVSVYIFLLLLSSVTKLKLRNETLSAENLRQPETHQVAVREVASHEGEDVTEEEKAVMTKSFRAADFDGDKLLSVSEIEMAISRETKKHIMGAMRNNFKVFFALDKNKKNGQVDWSEYYTYFLTDLLGLSNNEITTLEKSPAKIERSVHESISRLKAAWSEAAKSNPEAVNIDEFLSLEHPESSMAMLMGQVEELLEKHDDNEDGTITREEFVKDPFHDLDKKEESLRRTEFDKFLDKNNDGKASRKEVVQYIDPKSLHWANSEANSLVKQADGDADGLVSLAEMFLHPDLFLSSKMISPDISFHGTEF